MNKTVTVNISGIVFHIEEEAYERLGAYLQAIRSHFGNAEERNEIMADIEARIAEIFRERLGSGREVLIMEDVDFVTSVLGNPEDFAGETSEQNAGQQDASSSYTGAQQKHRRLLRDPDDKMIGGVCSGLAYYFGINVTWLRLGWAVLFFTFGFGALLYILFMIIVPKAETTAEKLEMRGEPVNIENIGRTVKEEFEQFGKRMGSAGQNFGSRAKQWGREQRDTYRRSRSNNAVENFFTDFFRVAGKIFATLLILIGALFLFGILTSLIGISNFGPNEFDHLLSRIFASNTQYIFGAIAIVLFFGIPCVLMIYKGIRMLFNLRRPQRLVNQISFASWFTGLLIGIGVIWSVGSEFREESEITKAIVLPAAHCQMLRIKVDVEPEMSIRHGHHYSKRWHDGGGFRHEIRAIGIDGDNLKFGYPRLHIVPGTSDSFELRVYYTSNGYTSKEASMLANKIAYKINAADSNLTLDSYFEIGQKTLWRDQGVDVEVRVPKGKSVYLDESTTDLLSDIHNVSDTYDGDMGGRRWMMTSKGLACVDCNGLDVDSDESAAGIIIAEPKTPVQTPVIVPNPAPADTIRKK